MPYIPEKQYKQMLSYDQKLLMENGILGVENELLKRNNKELTDQWLMIKEENKVLEDNLTACMRTRRHRCFPPYR